MSDAPRFDLDRRQLLKLLGASFAAFGISKRTAAAEPETLEIDRLWERGSSEKVVERLYRHIRAFRIFDGTSEIQKLIIARELLAGQRS